MKFKEKYTNEEVIKWAEKYLETKSINNVSKYFNISLTTVWFRLKKLGVIFDGSTKYSFDTDFFSRDTPESFYWAGFIAADGCIKIRGKTNTELSIALSQNDKAHLEKFKNIIGFSGPIFDEEYKSLKYDTLYKSSRITITITKTNCISGLQRFNIGPRKSLVYEFPKWMYKHTLVNHFIRGYSDGDGSFFYSTPCKKTHSPRPTFSLCGTQQFLTKIRDIFSIECGTNNNLKISFGNGIYNISYNGRNNVISIRDYLYKDSCENIELYRKHKIAFSVKESTINTAHNEVS